MGSVSGFVSGPAKFWIYPVVGLSIIGAPTLAAGWSNAVTTGAGQAARIVVDDAPKLVEGFGEGTGPVVGQTPPAAAADEPAAG